MTIAAIILAAGRSSRFSGGNKLIAMLDGKPLVRHVAEVALAANIGEVILVTGHEADGVAAAMKGLPFRAAHNNDFADGMASSIRAGISALPAGTSAAFLMLADMPLIKASTLDALLVTAEASPMMDAFVPVHDGRRGNPVLVRASLFATLKALSGDAGARRLLETMPERVAEVMVVDAGIHADFDTRAALATFRDQ